MLVVLRQLDVGLRSALVPRNHPQPDLYRLVSLAAPAVALRKTLLPLRMKIAARQLIALPRFRHMLKAFQRHAH